MSLTRSFAGKLAFAATAATIAATATWVSPTLAAAPNGGQLSLTTETQVVSSPAPSVFGQSVTFTATVTSTTGHAIPGGRVRFDVDGVAFVANVDVASDGTAQFSSSSLTPGTHEVVAMYSGYLPSEPDGLPDAQPSSDTLEQLVLNSTQTTLASSANPSTVGEPVTFSVTVVADGMAADGEVTFLGGSTTLGAVTVDANGQGSLTTTALTAGVHTITALYNGTDSLAPSSAEITQQVDEPPAPSTSSTTSSSTPPSTSTITSTTTPGRTETVTELSSSPNPSAAGQAVTFTATVTSVGGANGARSGNRAPAMPRQVDGGTLTISDGETILAVVPVAGGQASFSTSALSAGAHTIVATFSGTATVAPSDATIVQQVDGPPPTSPPATSAPLPPPATLPATS